MRQPKDLSLEGLRGLASLTVVLAHCWFIFFPYLGSRERPNGLGAKTIVDAFLYKQPFPLLYAADAAVVIFFVLSGYVLTKKFHETTDMDSIGSAATRRYIRLVLPAAASVLFAWAIMSSGLMANHLAWWIDGGGWILDNYTKPASLGFAIVNGLIGAPIFGDASLNGPLWTIQIELLGSIILFACYALFWRSGKIVTILWMLIFADLLGGHSASALYYVAIFAGSLLNLCTRWLRDHPGASSAFVFLGLAIIGVDRTDDYAWLRAIPLPNLLPYGPDLGTNPVLLWQTVASLLLVAGAIGCKWFAAFLASRIPAYLGRVSFAVYLLHFPLAMSLLCWLMYFNRHVLGAGFLISFALSFAGFMAVLLVLAEAFTRYVDQPSIRLAAAISNRGRGRRALSLSLGGDSPVASHRSEPFMPG